MEEINTRVSGLESDIRSLTGSLGALESDVKNVVRSVDNMSSVITNMATNLHKTSEVKWAPLGTWAGIIITILGSVGLILIQPMKDSLEQHQRINSKQYDLIRSMLSDYNNERVRTARVDQRVRDLERQLKEIKEEQKSRTSRVYSKKVNL